MRLKLTTPFAMFLYYLSNAGILFIGILAYQSTTFNPKPLFFVPLLLLIFAFPLIGNYLLRMVEFDNASIYVSSFLFEEIVPLERITEFKLASAMFKSFSFFEALYTVCDTSTKTIGKSLFC